MDHALTKGKTILLVHAGNEGKKFVIQKFKKMGLIVVCLNREIVPSLEHYVDHWITADLGNARECVEGIREFQLQHPRTPIQGAVTFWEECVLLTSKIIDTFEWIGIPYSVANIAKNKYNFRDFCRQNGLPAPFHKFLRSKKDIHRLSKTLRYPLVIKPVYGACSAFVVRANNPAELEETYDYVKNNIKSFWLAPEWENLEVFVEEYIDGDEVDIDLLLQNGKIKFFCISDNFNKNRGKFFVDSGQAIPSALPEEVQEHLLAMAEETLERLGIQHGCIHFEAKATKKETWPIEVNLRMGGDYIYSYVKSAWNVDLVECAAMIALGLFLKVEKLDQPRRYILGWDLQPESSGILVEQVVAKELYNKPYVDEIHLFKEIGDAVLRPPEGYDSLGWITVEGENILDAQDNLREALSFIHYKVVEFAARSVVGKTSRQNSLSVAVLKKNQLLQASKIEKVRLTSLKDQRALRLGIAGNKSHFNHHLPNVQIRAITQQIQQKLQERGYISRIFDFNDITQAFIALKRNGVDLVLNVTEGINNEGELKPQATALLEALQIPYSGSSSFTLALCRDKIRMKKLLAFHNIPTPKWDYAYSMQDTIRKDLRFPLIVKPSNVDEWLGLTNGSVVTDHRQLVRQLEKIIVDLGKAALVEEYIEGDEYEISILGNKEDDLKVLPLARSVFKKMPKGYWHIYTQEAKTKQQESIYKKIILQNPLKKMNPKLESLITEIALDSYKIVHCRDYGRVEVRVDSDDNPYIVDIDPNPPLDDRTQFLQSAKVTGMDYADLMEEIIRVAIRRYKHKKALF